MQIIPIVWPVLLCAFLTGVLFAWVWLVALPRIRRAEKTRLGLRAVPRGVGLLSRPSKLPVVEADQQAIRRNM